MIGTLLIVIAITLGVETKSLLVGEGATIADHDRIVGAITDGPEIEKIIHIKTLYLGPDELLVAAKLGFASDKPLASVAADNIAHGIALSDADRDRLRQAAIRLRHGQEIADGQ